jgi:CBS domain-containing protein
MKTAADLLKAKAHQSVFTTTPADSVFDAVKLMSEKNIGALLVTEGEEVVGIITERDYARKIILMSRSSKETPVREIMTSAVMYVHPSQTSEECMMLMTENRLRHLPVMDGNKLI